VNLSKLQVDCLKAMGIPLWQLREPQDATEAVEQQLVQPSMPQILSESAPNNSVPVTKPIPKAILKPLLAAESLAVPELTQVAQPPLLVAQLEQALSYCKKQSQQPATLSWSIDDSLTQIIKKDNQLSLPNLTQVFASASLKRQLWQLISHPSE